MGDLRQEGAQTPERFAVYERGKPLRRIGVATPLTYNEKCNESATHANEKGITYNYIEKGKDAYVCDEVFVKALGKWRRKWTSPTGQISTIQTDGGSIVKRLEKFKAHGHNETSFREFLREAAEFKCPRPSSYPDVFHSSFYTPRVHSGVNGLFAPVAHFAWQQALKPGRHKGHWRRYDINRAYLWASTCGLPRVESFRFVADPGGNYPALFRITLSQIAENAPYPFNTYLDVNATTEEIEQYGLRIAAVHGGVAWTDYLPSDAVTRVVDGLSFAKYVAKAYWGRWASRSGVTCITHGKAWTLPDNKSNLVWAHLIVSRVKRRLYEFADTAAHVYVDSIIVPHEIPTSASLGEWKLEKDYPDGVYVARTGMYGANSTNLDASTGTTERKRAAS